LAFLKHLVMMSLDNRGLRERMAYMVCLSKR
jgi:hypothetical protein